MVHLYRFILAHKCKYLFSAVFAQEVSIGTYAVLCIINHQPDVQVDLARVPSGELEVGDGGPDLKGSLHLRVNLVSRQNNEI